MSDAADNPGTVPDQSPPIPADATIILPVRNTLLFGVIEHDILPPAIECPLRDQKRSYSDQVATHRPRSRDHVVQAAARIIGDRAIEDQAMIVHPRDAFARHFAQKCFDRGSIGCRSSREPGTLDDTGWLQPDLFIWMKGAQG